MPEATLVVTLSFKIKAVYFCYNGRESNRGDYTFWSVREGLIFRLADCRVFNLGSVSSLGCLNASTVLPTQWLGARAKFLVHDVMMFTE